MPPEDDENVNAEEKNTFHGNDGLANIRAELIGSLSLAKQETDGYLTFDRLVEAAFDFDEILYIAVGPTTNLANLIEHDEIKSKISKVYIMGGGIKEFNCSNDTEFNFSKDPKSVKKILESGLDVTLFPL